MAAVFLYAGTALPGRVGDREVNIVDAFEAVGACASGLISRADVDVKPFGAHVMASVDQVGGVPVVMKALLDAGLLHGGCLTVTGRTVAENLTVAGRRGRQAARRVQRAASARG